MLDLYAGTGTIGMLLAHLFDQVYSIEIVQDATADARRNAEKNGIVNFEAINAPVERFLSDYIGQ